MVPRSSMSHPLVLALCRNPQAVAAAARAIHAAGVRAADLSVVARSHEAERVIAGDVDGTPGAEIEDSRPAARLGELGGVILAAIATVLPGAASLVTAGPLAAELGEAAGHAAGGVSSMLVKAGLSRAEAVEWQTQIEAGAVLLGVHARSASVEAVESALGRSGVGPVARATWDDGE
jgi:hypothetical protein